MDPITVAVMVGIMIAGACLVVCTAPDPLQQPQPPAVEDPEDEWPWS